ncbi:hypothetical protein F5884DRAFT_749703 [Xylogone sp. PMI_703]|nr:hypothetical protein F5884DRAFT_749703 [Xylogone sp. PMI_703]
MADTTTSPDQSSPLVLTVLGTRIFSHHRPEKTLYIISKPLNTVTSELTLVSLTVPSANGPGSGTPLYKLEYHGDDNALYIRSQADPSTSYPGFGELKYSRHLTGKRWDLRYEDGRNLVLSRKTKEQAENQQLAKWVNASGNTIATETEQGLELVEWLGVENQITGLLVAAWLARRWHADTAAERASEDANVKRRMHRSSSKRGDWNRFLGNFASSA